MTRPITGRVAPEQRRTSGAPAPGQPPVPGPRTARIAVDLLGGDHAPAVVVDGALRACQADPALQLLLVGPVEAADEVLAALTPDQRSRVRTVASPGTPPTRHATTGVGTPPPTHLATIEAPGTPPPTHHATTGWAPGTPPPTHQATIEAPGAPPPSHHADTGWAPGTPPPTHHANTGWVESGVRSAVLAVAEGNADAVVSAGNTGATVTSAALGLGRWPNVRRPALAAVLPTVSGRVVLLDVGSSVDPDEQTLVAHARLGAAYARVVHDLASPRVGLLTIGTERGKGDKLRRAAPAVLAAADLPAGGRYVGLVEGNDVVLGAAADVVVTDGFTGNVLLKGLETAYALIGSPIDTDVPPRAAILLGVAGTVVVCHGAATGPDLAAGIALAADLHRRVAVDAIAALLSDNEVTP